MADFDIRNQDTLISQSRIWLFGRTMADIRIDPAVYKHLRDEKNPRKLEQPPVLGSNNFILNQVAEGIEPMFARIYGYSYESIYHDLRRPTIFLVHGEGIDADTPDSRFDPNLALLDRAPAKVGRTGVATHAGSFAAGMKAWAYDRADFTMRLDAETGSFDLLLLAEEADEADYPAQSAGSLARPAGSLARPAGSLARPAGSLARPGRRNRSGE
jgi:hypothetical protein